MVLVVRGGEANEEEQRVDNVGVDINKVIGGCR